MFTNIFDFIKTNIIIRKNEITSPEKKPHYIDSECFVLLESIEKSNINFKDFLVEKNFNIIYKLSSKSFDTSNTLIINNTNRLEGLNCFLLNINYKTGKLFNNIKYVERYKYFFVSLYILAGQVFSDGNHRVCYQYLISHGINNVKVSRIIDMIDLFYRSNKNICWENLHEFIQKIINNLVMEVDLKNENLLLEKIEKIFI